MGTDEKYKRKGFLSDFLAKAKESEGRDVVRLRDEIRKEIEAGEKILGKFRGLVESFQDIISDEKQRYNAAIRALSTTSGLSRQNVLEATDNQLEELKMLEKGVMSALPEFRDDLNAMESKSKEIKNEIVKLHEKIGQLEKEEQELLDSMAARKTEMKAVEETVRRLFTDIGSEITGIRKKIEEFTAEKAPPQPIVPPVVESQKREEEKGGIEEESKIEWTPEPQETEGIKRCSMCGGQMDFNIQYGMWMCYACGHEEPSTDDTEVASELTTVPEPPPSAGPKPATVASSPSVKRLVSKKKTCPVCRKQMDWNEGEKTWRCSFCNYERRVF